MYWTTTNGASSDYQEHAIKVCQTTTEEGRGICFSGEDVRQQQGVGFIANKARIKPVIRCTAVFKRCIVSHLSSHLDKLLACHYFTSLIRLLKNDNWRVV